MPKYSFLKYGIEIRPNEHNHKGQKAHIHIYIHGGRGRLNVSER